MNRIRAVYVSHSNQQPSRPAVLFAPLRQFYEMKKKTEGTQATKQIEQRERGNEKNGAKKKANNADAFTIGPKTEKRAIPIKSNEKKSA